jgi:hypothetical protein
VDPLAADYTAFTPYHYTLNNPIRFIDPDGRSVEDYIFRVKTEDGSYKEVGRIVNDDPEDIVFDIDSEPIGKLFDNVNFQSIEVDGREVGANEESSGKPYDAIALTISVEGAFKVGGQAELSFVGMVNGPDKGEFGVLLGVNGLAGLDGGVTATAQFFYPAAASSLLLDDMRGFEYGIQGDAYMQATSFFTGFKFWRSPLKIGMHGQPIWQNPFKYEEVYHGWSVGMSFGGLPAGGSAYLGGADFIYRSDLKWFP